MYPKVYNGNLQDSQIILGKSCMGKEFLQMNGALRKNDDDASWANDKLMSDSITQRELDSRIFFFSINGEVS